MTTFTREYSLVSQKLGAFLILAAIIAGCQAAPQSATSGAALQLSPCHLSAPGSTIRLPAQCGTLTVYEDRAAQAGRRIDLRVAVIPALSRASAPETICPAGWKAAGCASG